MWTKSRLALLSLILCALAQGQGLSLPGLGLPALNLPPITLPSLGNILPSLGNLSSSLAELGQSIPPLIADVALFPDSPAGANDTTVAVNFGPLDLSGLTADVTESGRNYNIALQFANPSSTFPPFYLVNIVLRILHIPARLLDLSTGQMEGTLPDWWPKDMQSIASVEKSIREAVGATNGQARALLIPPNGPLKGSLFRLTVYPAPTSNQQAQMLVKSMGARTSTGSTGGQLGYTATTSGNKGGSSGSGLFAGPFGLTQALLGGAAGPQLFTDLGNLASGGGFLGLGTGSGLSGRNPMSSFISILDPLGFWQGLYSNVSSGSGLESLLPQGGVLGGLLPAGGLFGGSGLGLGSLVQGEVHQQVGKGGVEKVDAQVTIAPKSLDPTKITIQAKQNGSQIFIEAGSDFLQTPFLGIAPIPGLPGGVFAANPALALVAALLGDALSSKDLTGLTIRAPNNIDLLTIAEAVKKAFGTQDGKKTELLIPPSGPLAGAILKIDIYPKSTAVGGAGQQVVNNGGLKAGNSSSTANGLNVSGTVHNVSGSGGTGNQGVSIGDLKAGNASSTSNGLEVSSPVANASAVGGAGQQAVNNGGLKAGNSSSTANGLNVSGTVHNVSGGSRKLSEVVEPLHQKN